MSVLKELKDEIRGYAKKHIKLEIVNLTPYPQYGSSWNEDREIGTFQVKVTNTGELDVKNIKLYLKVFRQYGKLRWSDILRDFPMGVWRRSLRVGPFFPILKAGGEPVILGTGQFRAENDTNNQVTAVFQVCLADYDLSLDSLLIEATTGTCACSDTAEFEIHPD